MKRKIAVGLSEAEYVLLEELALVDNLTMSQVLRNGLIYQRDKLVLNDIKGEVKVSIEELLTEELVKDLLVKIILK